MTTTTAIESRTQGYLERGLAHLWVHTSQYNDLAKDDGLTVITSGDGIYLKDIKGRRFIDAMSGLWVVAVGHGRSELAEVAQEQMNRLAYANSFAYATEPAIDLATKLAELTPGNITRSYFVNSGSEAVETAIRMAKQYHYNRGDQKRYKIISRVKSYHGITAGALSVNGATYANRAPFEPLIPGSVHVQGINCDACPFEKTFPECDVFCARTIEDEIKFQNPDTVAAIIAEPISTANGCYVPPVEYWTKIREICDRHGILLIADEVIDGFGRTGEWFGIQHFPIQPDIMTVAKGLSSGYQPISAAMASQQVADAFLGTRKQALMGGITFGAHPVATAVALANIEIIERERLVQNSAAVGGYVAEQLAELKTRHRSISATRGIGLMHTVELQKNPEANEEFADEDNVGEILGGLLAEQGLLARAGSSIAVAPPLVINREQVDELVDMLDGAIGNLEREFGLT